MASKSLSSLVVDVRTNTSQFQSGIKSASKQLVTFKSQAVDAAKGVATIATAATALTAGLLLSTKKSLDYADAIGKAATNTGFSTDRVQELRFALDKYGLSQQQADKSLADFNKNLGGFKLGVGDAKAAYEQLGISAKNADGTFKSNSDVYNEVINKLGGVKDGATRAALANKLFGEEAGKVMAIVSTNGVAGLDSYAESAKKLGIVMSESLIRESEAANDKLSALMEVLKVHGVKAALAFTPYIIELTEKFTENASAIAGAVTSVGEFIHAIASGIGSISSFSAELAKLTGASNDDYAVKIEEKRNALVKERLRLINNIDSGVAVDFYSAKLKDLEAELAGLNAILVKMGNAETNLNKIKPSQSSPLSLPATILQPTSAQSKIKDKVKEQQAAFDSLRQSMGTTSQKVRENLEQQALWISGASEAFAATDEWREGMKKLQAELDELLGRKTEYEVFYEDISTAGVEAFNELSRSVESWGDTLADQLARGEFDFKSFVSSIMTDIARMQIKRGITDPLVGFINSGISGIFTRQQELSADFVGPPSSLAGGSGGGILSSIGDFFGGFFADGGTPPVGKVSVVGERGPELFVPNTAGTIIPNNAIGGGGVNIITTVNVDGGGQSDGETISKNVVRAIKSIVSSELQNQMRPGNILSPARRA